MVCICGVICVVFVDVDVYSVCVYVYMYVVCDMWGMYVGSV